MSIQPSKGRVAKTLWEKKEELAGLFSLLTVSPKTGRTHQIRVHAAAGGIPIIGDNFYGGREAASLCLVSYAIEFKHPLTNQHIAVDLPQHLTPDWVSFALPTQT
jgi:23S rRNA-/tRNA-specific pseudouridylate synthase